MVAKIGGPLERVSQVTETRTYKFTVTETGGGAVVRQAAFTVTETTTTFINADGTTFGDPRQGQISAEASVNGTNTGAGQANFSEAQLGVMSTNIANIIRVSRSANYDPSIMLGIAWTESMFGYWPSKETSPAKQTNVNPTQLSKTSGLKPSTNPVTNILGSWQVFGQAAAKASSLNAALQVYNSQAGKVAYANKTEGYIQTIRRAINEGGYSRQTRPIW